MKNIKIIAENDECIPFKTFPEDAGFDLKLNQPKLTISPGQKVKLHTGVKIEIPRGYAGFVFPRSGLGTKFSVSLANTIGVIDSNYRGEIVVFLVNHGEDQVILDKYERFAQLVIMPIFAGKLHRVEQLADSNRGEGGFGHTGRG